MTPERKVEIKKVAKLYPRTPSSYVNELLDALEEAQQQREAYKEEYFRENAENVRNERLLAEAQQTIALKQSSIDILAGQVTDETALHAKTAAKLIIAEQTIARLTEGVKEIRGKHVYVSGPSVVCEMLGRLIEAHPPCPACGCKNTIDHPTRTDIRLCVPCEKTYTVPGEGAKEA